MSELHLKHESQEIRFTPELLQLEIVENEQKIRLTPTHSRFLSLLANKSREIVTYEELRLFVWSHSRELDDSLKRLIQTTKGDLVKQLKSNGIRSDIIENVPGQGYRLKAEVKTNDNSGKTPLMEKFNTRLPSALNDFLFGQNTVFKFSVSIVYGMLFLIVLVLESAYRFAEFQAKILAFSVPFVLFNSLMMYLSLFYAEKSLLNEKRRSFSGGVLILITGALVSCFLASFILPDEPVTLARFQTQPAFAAFLKNVLVYILPLGIFFVLLPFYTLTGRRSGKEIFGFSPKMLFVIWLAALVYSLISTFYLLDNLLLSEYHGLFVTFTFLRFITYFGLGLSVLVWYQPNFLKIE